MLRESPVLKSYSNTFILVVTAAREAIGTVTLGTVCGRGFMYSRPRHQESWIDKAKGKSGTSTAACYGSKSSNSAGLSS